MGSNVYVRVFVSVCAWICVCILEEEAFHNAINWKKQITVLDENPALLHQQKEEVMKEG